MAERTKLPIDVAGPTTSVGCGILQAKTHNIISQWELKVSAWNEALPDFDEPSNIIVEPKTLAFFPGVGREGF